MLDDIETNVDNVDEGMEDDEIVVREIRMKMMVAEPFYLKIVCELFENASNHVPQTFDDAKEFAITMFTKEQVRDESKVVATLQRILKKGSYPLDVIIKVEQEIPNTEYILLPSSLEKDEIQKDPKLYGSLFSMLTYEYGRVMDSHVTVTGCRIQAEAKAKGTILEFTKDFKSR